MKVKMPWPLRRFLVDGNVRTKLLCIYFVLIILPLGFFTLYAFQRINTVLQQQTLAAAGKAFDDTVLELDTTMRKLDNVQEILVNDSLIYQMSSNDPRDYPFLQQLEESNQLTTTLEHLIMLSGVDDIRLYVDNDFLYRNEARHIFSLGDVRESRWYNRLKVHPNMQWFSPTDFADQTRNEQIWFSSIRVLYNPTDIMEPLSVLRADIRADRIAAVIDKRPITENGCLILTQGDNVLLASEKGAFEELPSDILPQLSKLPPNMWSTVTVGSQWYYVNSTPLSQNSWQLTTIVPYNDIFRVSRELRVEMLLVMFVIGVVAYVLAYFISKSTLNRLSQLSGTMESVESGNTEVKLIPSGNDEIGRLMRTFNSMMEQINRLMEEKIQFGQEIKNLELKALQAQINPHFLYNTLDLINCIAIERNVEEIADTVTALADFYQISLSQGQDVITIREELAHAAAYLKIQDLRFEGQLLTQWEIDEDTLGCAIIKIVLQPIIENAVIHGIFERPDKSGMLWIRAWSAESDIYLSVEDNGMGMDLETLHANFDPPPPGSIANPKGGYGIRNIDDRLRLAYGEGYGLTCTSTIGVGTTVTLHIPRL